MMILAGFQKNQSNDGHRGESNPRLRLSAAICCHRPACYHYTTAAINKDKLMFLYFKFNYICSDNLLTSMMHATMALTDILRMSYEPPRMGRPPARERRVACGEARDGSYGVPSSTKTKFLCVAPPQEAPRI